MESEVARAGMGKEERLLRARVEWVERVLRWGERKMVRVAGGQRGLRQGLATGRSRGIDTY